MHAEDSVSQPVDLDAPAAVEHPEEHAGRADSPMNVVATTRLL